MQESIASFGSADYRMAATPRYNTEILFSEFIHAKKITWPTKIPSNARLLICDATYMYKNIRKGLALHRIGRFYFDNEKHLSVPPAVFMDALRLLMTNKVFQFGDNYWL